MRDASHGCRNDWAPTATFDGPARTATTRAVSPSARAARGQKIAFGATVEPAAPTTGIGSMEKANT